MSRFTLEISYSQLAVFNSRLSHPFNDWTEAHVAQGFTWRPGSVSFGTLSDGGTIAIEVVTRQRYSDQTSGANRVIRVPFEVAECGDIEVASIGTSAHVVLEPGFYALTFEHGLHEETGMWARLYLEKTTDNIEAAILRADGALRPSQPLLMTAQPA